MIASTLLRDLDLRWWLVFQIQLALVLRSDSSLILWSFKDDNLVVLMAASFNWGTAASRPIRILSKLLYRSACLSNWSKIRRASKGHIFGQPLWCGLAAEHRCTLFWECCLWWRFVFRKVSHFGVFWTCHWCYFSGIEWEAHSILLTRARLVLYLF